MRLLALKAVLIGLACCGGVLSASRRAHAQGRPAPPRSVVLKPAPVRISALAPSPALRETPALPSRLDTIPPDAPPHDRWLALDKAKHFGGSFLVVLGSQYVFEEKAALQRDPALALSLGTGAAVGLGKELYDWRLGPSRHFSARDLAADALGLLLAAGVVLL